MISTDWPRLLTSRTKFFKACLRLINFELLNSDKNTLQIVTRDPYRFFASRELATYVNQTKDKDQTEVAVHPEKILSASLSVSLLPISSQRPLISKVLTGLRV